MRNIIISNKNRLPEVHFTRVGCRGVIVKDDKILLSGMVMPDIPGEVFYLIPGGGQDEGETLEQCCEREVREETGLKVRPKEHFLTLTEFYEDNCFVNHYFACEIEGETARSLTDAEIAYQLKAEWMPLDEAILRFGRYEEYMKVDEGWSSAYLREYTALVEFIRFCNETEGLPEYHELHHRNGTPTGRILQKHRKDAPGDYFLHSIIVLKTADSPRPGEGEGCYIMQQRSLKARYYAGKWDVTGGGVKAYETYEGAACREAKEELGLEIDPSSLKEFHQYYADWADGSGLILKVFACRAKVPAEGFHFNPMEVNDVKVVPFHVFKEHVLDHNDEAFGRALDRIEAEV